jgi:Sugar (and other) transporter
MLIFMLTRTLLHVVDLEQGGSRVLPSAGSAVAFAMVTHWVCNFGIGQLFLPAVARYGVSTVYLGFAAVCVTASLFVAAFVLETKGRTLEQIEAAMAA